MLWFDWLAVIDIKDAYRAVSVHSSNIHYQGLVWNFLGENVYLLDTRLCMGLASSPYRFQRISNFIVRCAHH